MSLIAIKKYKFAYDFYETRRLYPFYENAINRTNGKDYFNTQKTELNDLVNFIHVVNYINPYYDLIINEKETPLKAFKIDKDKGYMAQLNEFKSIEEYMGSKMSSKSRTKMRSYKRRLETCFNISYKMYFGEITKNDYDHLFSKFNLFLSKRFLQRGDEHEALARWDSLKENTFDMIMNKTASLFVIYNGNQPIDICLNYHHQNIIDNAIRSYDIDYSKFRLGYIDIYKQLEWCFQNGVEIFDLSLGDFDYKRLWCNVIYDFKHHILYNKNSFVKKVLAYTIVGFYNTKEYLKKKNVHLYYQKIKNIFKVKIRSGGSDYEHILELEELENLPLLDDITQIDFLLEKYRILRKTIYDFQYMNSDSSKNIRIYEMNNQKGIFFVKGRKKILKINLV
ncbi:MAG: GNAT family N-acetyltransferase [Maribacter sp.]